MKKNWLFLFSIFIALLITFYNKKSNDVGSDSSNPHWNTYVKNTNLGVLSHKATLKELEAARVPTQKREIAEEKNQTENDGHNSSPEQKKIIQNNHFLLREDRVLIGDIQNKNYQDQNSDLEMMNKINPNWKHILSSELLRFQKDDTKLMIKEEFSIIQVQEGKGHYTEQIIVTYVLKNGTVSSFRALVDSETGAIVETWDKTIHENFKRERTKLTLPSENNSGIIVR